MRVSIFMNLLGIRTYVFQAESDEEMKDWMKSFELAKMNSLHPPLADSPSTTSNNDKAVKIEELTKNDTNDVNLNDS